ncbi:acyltransferase [Flavobacterium pectinovorum]|uniref:Surface polysaccharide O-acyltransferase, integral membrane enzyme n=1 Tax=Flavobacterium pectinovorum TaxID=29533 RepID=A0AB36P6V5_9FLAO|nr:acyltransferase family protein [Flavobacterium pectinovorum]OXB07623.1 hypothetical protein B0A72_01800 [Flavobacterium pectinovorum]SHM74295.1 Surface polysaccharide O-acyltransferase, integral membrane enzyme [Flavobacterium pectinovorum]
MNTKENFLWISNLRVIAVIAVIFVHTASPLVMKFGVLSNQLWNYANFYDAIFRFCVPVFVMISGALLLNKEYEFRTFFIKRFIRIGLPFLFWSICYVLYSIFIKTDDYKKLHFFGIIKKLIRSVYFGSAYHLWYVYMLFGLILIIPILNVWISKAKKSEIHYFLLLWSITLLFKNFGFENYKPAIDLSYFSGYVGYLVLGYYLSVIEIKNIKKWRIIAILVFILGSLITFFSTYWFSVSKGKIDSSLYDFFSFNVLLASIGIFIFFRLSNFLNSKTNVVLVQISNLSYGIYLIHVLVLSILDSFGINASFINPVIGTPITVFLCLSISTLIIKIINTNKTGSYISG